MGFSVSGATVVLLLAVLVGGLTVATTLEEVSEARNAGVSAEEERLLERLNTDVDVTDAVYNESADSLTVTAENTGSTALDTDATDLLVDGVFASVSTVSVGNTTGRELWTPGTTARLTVEDVTDSPDRVKLVTETGIAVVRTSVTTTT